MKASELMNEPISIHVDSSGFAVVTPHEERLQQAFEILETQIEEISNKLDERITELENKRGYIEALNLKEMRELRDAIKENVKNTPELINVLDSIINNIEPFINRVIELETRIENLEKFHTIAMLH